MGRRKQTPPGASAGFVAYYRVSTSKQGESGLGLDAQRTAVQNYVSSRGPILASFTEVETGKKADRPQLAAALAASRKLGATLVIAKLDRLARNVAFIAKLMEDATDFVACDMPAANKLTLHILASMAEFEAKQISDRTRAGLAVVKQELKDKGFRVSKRTGNKFTKLGNPNWTKALVKANANRKYMRTPDRIYGMLDSLRKEGRSFQAIADHMNELGIRTPGGSQWYATSVRNELKKRTEELPKAA